MNLRATIVLSALIILLLGCKDNKETVSSNTPVGTVLAEPEKEYLQEKKYTLLLIDKTISSETGALDEKYEEKVAELVKTNFEVESHIAYKFDTLNQTILSILEIKGR